jgi:hypothetical protein
MKNVHMWAMGGVAAILAISAPASQVFAQADDGNAVDSSAVVGADHGNFTLKQREDWLSDRLRVARDDGSINGSEFDRVHHELDRIHDEENHLRSDHDGQLTDNETSTLEARLDGVADQIHWLHEDQFRKPW